jgi:hypothetical protein
VWDRLVAEVPSADGTGLIYPSLMIRVDPWLPRGAVIPLDAHGCPMSRPRVVAPPPPPDDDDDVLAPLRSQVPGRLP